MVGLLRSAAKCLLLAPLCGHAGSSARDADLEQRGARIGTIEIEVDDVFEKTTRLAAPYRIVNDLHITTHDETVQQQLLFHTGDCYNRRVLDETARLLRAQRYLNEATVEPVRYNEADNTVDVLVRVHDVWTLSPGLSFGRKGGENSTRVKFEDTNFLGLGKELSLARSSNVDRTAWELGYVDPNVLGSWWQLSAGHWSLSDGSESRVSLERPFYAMDTRWSAGFSAADSTTAVSRYSLGHAVERLQMQERKFELGGGFSEGLREGWTTRYLSGLRYDAREFAARPDEPLASIPKDRVLAYPWIGFEVLEDQYVSTRNLDQIGRTEDLFNVGAAVFFDAGRTWGRDAFAAPPAGWLKDVGLGLRLGSARSGLGNVLHIDLAFPLDRSSDIDSLQLLIETRKSF